jgi:hypothetical protein
MHKRLKRAALPGALIAMSLASFAATAAEPVRSVELVESSAFLEGYRSASEAQSADFYDLYSDRAIVHVRVQDHEQGIAFQGRAFKAWGRQLLKEGRAAPDGSIFQEASVEQRGTRLLIRAKRFSTCKCYWDLSYQVGIEREGASYRIVDERLTTQPAASCASTHARRNASASPVSVTPADATLATIGNLRAPNSENLTWHPLSQQELADEAMRLAQQLSQAGASQFHAAGVSSRDLIGAAPVEIPDKGAVSRGRVNETGDLRVTPPQ